MTIKPTKAEPHLRDYLRPLFVNAWMLAGIFTAAVVGTALFVFTTTPVYRAETVLLIEPNKANITDIKAGYDPGIAGELARREFFETQYQLLLSRDVLERTFQAMGFDKFDEFKEEEDPVEAFKELFDVEPVKRSRLVRVKFDWTGPELSAKTVDYLVNAYIADFRSRTLGVTGTGLDSLRAKVAELRPKVEAKSGELQQFVAKSDVVSLDKTQNIVVDRLSELSRDLSEVKRKRIEFESIHENMQQAFKRMEIEQLPEVASNPALRDLKLEYLKTKQDVSELGKRLGPRHPEVERANSRFKTVSDKLDQEMKYALSVVKSQVQRLGKQENELAKEMAAQEKKVLQLNKQAAKYNLLTDSYSNINETYNAMVKRIEEIEVNMAVGSKEDNIFVIEKARVPVKPVKPKKTLSLALACLMGLVLGAGACYFIEYLDTTVKDKEEIEGILGVPVIGYIPSLAGKLIPEQYRKGNRPIELYTVANDRSPLAEAFRSIRTALSFAAAGKGLRVIQVTSAVPSEGKTLASINVAISLARAEKNVLLIDADMRKPRVHKVFGFKNAVGLSNLLAAGDHLEAERAIHTIEPIPRLSVLCSGVIPPNPAELLGSEAMKRLLAELGRRYDAIVIDTPPVVNVTDSVVLSELVDGTILVVRAFSTQRKLIEIAREQLSHAKARVVGFVLNNANVPSRGYAYYSYDYYKQSGYYAAEPGEGRHGARKSPGPRRLLPRLFARKEKRAVPDGDAEATSRRAKT